jgi:hypothetical protein
MVIIMWERFSLKQLLPWPAQLGIRIYTVGLGTTGEVPVEFLDREEGKIITGTLV